MDLESYLLGLDGRGLLPRPKIPLAARVGYHQPCHQRSLGIGAPALDLLRMVPGLEVEHIDRGCSGMGGIYGLYRDNFRTSLRAGRGLARRLREADIDLGASECGACRMQMSQGSTKRVYHPLQILALGYGLDPALRTRYRNPKPRKEIV
jgi:Fe-S oxidoreductase